MNNVKMVLFDVDDTLIYTIDTAYRKTNIAGNKAYNKKLKKNEFINLYGKYNFEECIKLWYSTEDISEFINEYNNINLKYEYICNIKEMIETIKKNNIIIGIVTNSTKEKTERKLGEYATSFDFIYVNAEKPNPKIIFEIINKYNIKNEGIILVGDSESDYQVCKNANINFCGVNTGKNNWNNKKVQFIESIKDFRYII